MGAKILERARFAAVLFVAALLSGCMGGSIARQVASSIAMRVADKALDQALQEPQVEETGQTNRLLMRSGLDPYQEAFLRAQLITPPEPALPAPPDPAASAVPTVTRLATVEVWSLVVGEEKRAMLESMRELGIATLPPEHAWEQWQLAEGGMAELSDRALLILVPPELGKMRSGDRAVIEVGIANGFYVAKDRLE